MQPLKAHVHNGSIDEVLGSGGDYLDDEERAALHRSIDEGIEDFERGETEDAFELLARLKAHREDPDRKASQPPGRTGR